MSSSRKPPVLDQRRRCATVITRRDLELRLPSRAFETMTGHEQQHPVEHKRYLMVDLIRRGTGQIRMFVEIHDDDAWNFDVYPGLPVLVDIPPNDGAVRILRRLESNKKFVKRT